MTRRNLIILISSVFAILVLAIILLVVFWQRPNGNGGENNTNGTVDTNQNSNGTITNSTSNDGDTNAVIPDTVDRNERQAITSAATSFTERFGSYSTDTNFENIERSRYLMTDNMERQADAIVRQGQADDTFSSVQSTVAGVVITDYSDGATGATVEVSVRQGKRTGTAAATSYSNAKANLTLKKVDDQWLVDSFHWL
jgi:hypothetical protein